MSHDYHEGHPRYSPDHIWHDGCEECDYRSTHLAQGVGTLDNERFARAWQRAHLLRTGKLTSASDAELPLLELFAALLARNVGPLEPVMAIVDQGRVIDVLSRYFARAEQDAAEANPAPVISTPPL